MFAPRRVALEGAGLPGNSKAPYRGRVKRFVSMLENTKKEAGDQIEKTQEVGVVLALMNDLCTLCDPKVDPKLRHKIAESFLDRDPQGRTLKRKVVTC